MNKLKFAFALLSLGLSSAAAGEVQFSLLRRQPSGSVAEGVKVQAIVFERSTDWPPTRIGSVEQVGDAVHVHLIRPLEPQNVASYDTALSADLPQLEPGTYRLLLFDNRPPAGPSPEPLDQLQFTVSSRGIQLEYAGPPDPGPEDEIVLRLSHRPCHNSPPPVVDVADFHLRLRGDACWTPLPAGYEVPVGRLAAGKWLLEIETTYDAVEDQIELVIAGPPPEPGIFLANDFEVEVAWRTALGEEGEGRLVQPPSQDSALFYFFSPANWELMIKVLDACAINGHYWVFGAASTDVGYTVDIRRRGSTQTFRIENPIGRAAPAITDIGAFPCDPAAP